MSEQTFTAHENCVYAGDPPLLTGNQSRLVAECSSPQRAAFIVRACNSHAALVEALGKALVCLKPQGRPEREGDPYYEVICEMRDALARGAA